MPSNDVARTAPPEISVVLPAHNEQDGIAYFHAEVLVPALETQLDAPFEVVYVNDGSTDATLELLTEIADADSRVRVINLSRNFGKEVAVTAGIAQSRGGATVIMDADGQHPPALIGEFVAWWRAGAQVVVGVRQSNQREGMMKRIGSRSFYRLLNAISEMQTVPRSTDYRLIDSDVRREFLRFTERNRITRGLIDWLGFRRAYVEFDAPARIAGDASYTVGKLFGLAVTSFTTMSLRPLFFFGYVGVACTLLALLAGVFIGVEQFLLGDPLHLRFSGAALLGIFVTFMVGIVLTAQGMMAVYLAHIHAQAQNRPLYVVDRVGSRGLGPMEDTL